MFLLASIWKRLSAGIIIALILGSGLFSAPGAHATSEKYAWKDSAESAISASDGSYAASVELAKSGQDSSGINFSGSGKITCGTSTADASFVIHVDQADYGKKDPTPSTLQVVSTCTTASFDASPMIVAASASNPPASSATNPDPDQCDAGSFGWAVCPLTTQIAKVTTSLLSSALTPFLHVQPITKTGTPGLYQTWLGVKNFSEVLFIVIFMIIIFATITGSMLDQYTIKRMLPRVVAAAILVQFSFFISGFIVDIGNIAGAGIMDVVNIVASGTPHAQGDKWDITSNVVVIIAAIIGGQALWHAGFISLPVIGLMLIAVFAVLITLVARFVLIAGLIAVSPLAFVAWVLPNTNHYYKKWSSLFVRIILMYPIIMGVFALARIVDQLVSIGGDTAASGVASVAVSLLKPFIFIVTFLLIPFAFKWAGGAMTKTHGAIGGFARSIQGRVKNSESYQRSQEKAQARQIKRMQKFENLRPVRSLTNNAGTGFGGKAARGLGGGLMSARALSLGGAPTTRESLQKMYSKQVNNANKEMGELEEAQDIGMLMKIFEASYGTKDEKAKAMKMISENAPSLMRYTQTEAGRMAALKNLASKGMVSESILSRIATNAPNEYRNALRASGGNWKAKPAILARWSEGEVEVDKQGNRTVHKAGEIKESALTNSVAGWDSQAIKSDVAPENWEFARKNDVVSKILGNSVKYTIYDDILSSNSRTRAQAPKRAEIYKWIADKHTALEAEGGNASKVVESAMDKLYTENADILADLVKHAYTNDEDGKRTPYKPNYVQNFSDPNDHTKWSDTEIKLYLDDWFSR